MKKIIAVCIFLHLVILAADCSVKDYIWINYSARLPIKNINTTMGAASIPCEVRIGTCTIKYDVLPLGWTTTPDGKMLFPLTDAKLGPFAITATLTDIFDDQIHADLVVSFENGALTVQDRPQFLTTNGFDPKSSLAKPLEKLEDVPVNPISLDGFPKIGQLESLIKFGNIYTISSKLKQVSEKYAPCQDRIGYLSAISQALAKKIAENQLLIGAYKQQMEGLLQKLSGLQTQKKEAQKKLSGDKSFSELQKSLQNLNSTKNQLQSNLTKYEYLSNRYLSNLNSVSSGIDGSNSTQEELEITRMEDEVKQLEQTISEALKKKTDLQESISKRKASLSSKGVKQPKDNQTELMNAYESKYREYSDLALNTRIQLQWVNQQITSLTSKYNIKTVEITELDKKLSGVKKDLSVKQSATALQVQQEQLDTNQILKLSADNMLNKINLLKATQCAY